MAKSAHGLALRYGQAIFEIAREKRAFDKFSDSLARAGQLIIVPEIKEFLESPKVSFADKQKPFANLKNGIEPLVINALFLLISRNHLDLFGDVLEEFNRRLDDIRGIAHGQIITAVPLSNDEYEAIKKQLKGIFGKEIKLEPSTDERILGGLVVRIGDKVLDGSTAGRLDALRRRLAASRG